LRRTGIFAPNRLTQTITEMQAAQGPAATPGPATLTRAPKPPSPTATPAWPATRPPSTPEPTPQAIAEWTRQVKAERAAALARDATRARHQTSRRLTEDDIRILIASLGDLRNLIRKAEPARESSHLRIARAQGHLPARAKQTPSRSNHRPGAIWGYGLCPRSECTKKPMHPDW
jgi:hypothetical protein